MVILVIVMCVVAILAAILDLQTSLVNDTSPLLLSGGQNRQRQYVSGRIRNKMCGFYCFMFVAAILNVSISPRVPEWRGPDPQCIGHVVSYTFIKHWVDSNATPNHCLAAGSI